MITDKGFSTKVTDEDIAKGIKDEFGAVYSSDGKRLLKCVNTASYCIKPGTQVICDDAFVSCGLANIIIPDTITHIGSYAFYKCSGLTSIIIPKSVSYIGERAFSNCRNLRSIILPDSLTQIGNSAFSYCETLTEITIPDSVTHIGDEVFTDCYCLANITIPNSITHIGNKAFLSCNNLTSITIPDSVTYIGDKAFFYCVALTEITIPDSVTHIGKHAFEGCRGMTVIRVSGNNPIFDSRENCNAIIETASNTLLVGCKNTIIPDSISRIGDYAFYSCEALTEIAIPDSVKQIGDFAFYGCKDLNSITIPRFATHIGSHAFSGCKALAEISLPDSISHIGDNAFYPCNAISVIHMPARCYDRYKLLLPGFESIFQVCEQKESAVTRVSTKVTVEDKANGVIDEFGALYSPDGKRLLKGVNTASYCIKPGTQVICDKAFMNCTGLVSVTIPNSVTHFGDEVFFSCSSLTRIIIPDSVIYIGVGAFSFCDALTRISIPDSVALIGDSIFSHCEALTSVNISNSVTYIGDRAFSECESLTSITIPDTVTHIGDQAFSSCSSLASITLPNSITHIGKGVFSYCSDLANITIPNTVTQIDDHAFSECENLASITIPDSVVQIGKEAFCDCSGLESITLPDTVTHIGELAFNRCSGLTRIQVSNNNKMYDSRGNCNAIIQSATNTLIIGCQNTIIPDSVSRIGYGAFSFCRGLTEITIPDSVTHIETFAFSNCNALTKVTIPNSVTHIENAAFACCDALVEIRIPAGSTNKFKLLLPDLEDKFVENSLPNNSYNSGHTAVNEVSTDKNDKVYSREQLESLKKVTKDDAANAWKDEFGVFYSADKTRLLRAPKNISEYSIPEGTRIICDWAFGECESLRTVELCKSLIAIGFRAFHECTSLKTIVVPGSIKEIDTAAFFSCDSLQTATILEGVEIIGEEAFNCCSALNSIDLPNSLTTIGDWAFAGCGSLKSFSIPSSVTHIGREVFELCDCKIINKSEYFRTNGFDLYSVKNKTLIYCSPSIVKYNIPDSVSIIGHYAFFDCAKLKSIVIPDTVTRIEDGAFCGCSFLSRIILSKSLTDIGDNAFSSCKCLKSIILPESIVNIGKKPFESCDSLTVIYVPKGTLARFEELLSDNKGIIKETENQDGLNNDNQARIANEYHILEIYPSEDGRYGDIIVIEANPVEERPGGKAIVQHHYNGTEIFFFPHDSFLIQPILRIAQSRGLWSPNPDDYEEEIVTRESTNRDVLIHRHVSFWDEDFDRSMNRGKRTISIPNSQLKVQQLTQQYINGGWNSLYTLREYIESLAEGEDVENFCGWLFDNPSLNGKYFWELDDEYVNAYIDFLNQFI